MAEISMNELTTYRWSFEEDVARYKAAGFHAISVWRQKLSDLGDEKGAALLAESGLRAASVLWAGGFTGSDGRTFRDAVDDAQEAIDTATTLQAKCVVVYAGARGGHTHSHARRLLKMALKELDAPATASGVTLAIEPMHRGCGSEFTFLETVDETLDVIADAGVSRARLALDTYHVGHDPSLLAKLPQWAPHIAIVQLGDCRHAPCGEQNRCRLGEGVIPLPAIVQTLAAAGYDGDYDIELLGEDLEDTAYDELVAHSRRYVTRLLTGGGRAAG